jgi:hypothetical protein
MSLENVNPIPGAGNGVGTNLCLDNGRPKATNPAPRAQRRVRPRNYAAEPIPASHVLTLLEGISVTKTGLIFERELTSREWKLVGFKLRQWGDSFRWAIGHWWAYGEDKGYGHRKAIAIAIFGRESYQTVMDYGYVFRNVAPSLRNDILYEALSWSHYKVVAPLEPDKQKYWLDEAVRNNRNKWNVRELRQKIFEAGIATLSEDEKRLHWKNWYLRQVVEAVQIAANFYITEPHKDSEFVQHVEGVEPHYLAKYLKVCEDGEAFCHQLAALIRQVLYAGEGFSSPQINEIGVENELVTEGARQ